MNIVQKITALFQKNDEKREEMIYQLAQANQVTNNHLIALARLLFIKPETLLREAKNIKANADYLLKLMELNMEDPALKEGDDTHAN